jgi:hypothetical protein
MSDTYYPSLDAYNADVERARNAYAADEAVRAGLCAVCKTNKKDGADHRRCWSSRRTGKHEATS